MSRHDNIGFFWEDTARVVERGKHVTPRVLPPIPDTGWRPPTEFPNLRDCKIVALDCETKDLDLRTKGPGARRDGHIVGLAVGTQDGGRWYFPMRHEVQPEHNLNPEHVMAWARDHLCTPKQAKVGANLLYDLEYLYLAGVPVTGPFIDVQVAEPLIDETAGTYALDVIARKYLGEGKNDSELYAWSYSAYGGKEGRSQAENIYRCPPCLVGPYAEADVDLPLRIIPKQKELIEADELSHVWRLETRLIPLLLAMRLRGVRVDVQAAQRAYDDLSDRFKRGTDRLGGLNVYSADDLARYCRKNGIDHPRTAASSRFPEGQPSFTKDWLERHTDPGLRHVASMRRLLKIRDTFIQGYILDSNIGGRIHCKFNQLRSDEEGTVSGRFSSSYPNLQNIPSRDPEFGPMMRRMFLPEDGELWAKLDWSQIEYRFLTHYGEGKGADEAREMYRTDPSTDFHVMTSEIVGIERRAAKNINFGLVYGMGERHMADVLGRSLEDIKPMFELYHSRLPFVRNTFNNVMRRAQSRGWIKTLLGRRRRFNDWEEETWGDPNAKTWPSREAAIEALTRIATDESLRTGRPVRMPKVRRAYTNAALNALLQGGAADTMKAAMVQIWEAGLCADDALGPMLLTVHDEGDFSVPQGKESLIHEVKRIMETCVTLRVPVVAELEMGPNWADLKEVE